jgi:hypothetical protein
MSKEEVKMDAHSRTHSVREIQKILRWEVKKMM